MKVLDILKCAREKINSPKKWCVNNFATNDWGVPVPANHPDACAFCVRGAVMNCLNTSVNFWDLDQYEEIEAALGQGHKKAGGRSFNWDFDSAEVNNKLGWEATITMLDNAIEILSPANGNPAEEPEGANGQSASTSD